MVECDLAKVEVAGSNPVSRFFPKQHFLASLWRGFVSARRGPSSPGRWFLPERRGLSTERDMFSLHALRCRLNDVGSRQNGFSSRLNNICCRLSGLGWSPNRISSSERTLPVAEPVKGWATRFSSCRQGEAKEHADFLNGWRNKVMSGQIF